MATVTNQSSQHFLALTAPCADAPPSADGRVGFALFLLLNAVLFIRPSEIFSGLEGWPIYNCIMILCVAASLPLVVRQLSWRHLRRVPGVCVVLLMLPAIAASRIVQGDFYTARYGAIEIGKVLVYFLLFVAVINTSSRLNRFLIAMVMFIVGIAVIAELNYHGILDVNGIKIVDRATGEDETGERVTVPQLYGPGIFNDPNDFSLILSAGILILVHFGLEARSRPIKFALLGTSAGPGYAFSLTQSRGGFLALAAGLSVLSIWRFGWRRSLAIALLGLPLMLTLFAGRMTDISLDQGDTARGRVDLWRDGFVVMRSSPLFGIGYGQFVEEMGLVAHNSFVHTFVELGLVGGVVFTAAFYVPIDVLRGWRPPPGHHESQLARLRPPLLAVLVSYAVGLCAISRPYTISTYLILGCGAAYTTLLAGVHPEAVPSLTRRYISRIVIVGFVCVIFFYLVTRVI